MKTLRDAGEDSPMLIGGQWVRRKERIEVRNPFDGALVGSVPAGETSDARAAVDAARAFARRTPV